MESLHADDIALLRLVRPEEEWGMQTGTGLNCCLQMFGYSF